MGGATGCVSLPTLFVWLGLLRLVTTPRLHSTLAAGAVKMRRKKLLTGTAAAAMIGQRARGVRH
jgi:hypothetical protein